MSKFGLAQYASLFVVVFAIEGGLESVMAESAMASTGQRPVPINAKNSNSRILAQARVAHAKELLGKHFKKVAKSADQSKRVNRYILEVTKKSLSKKHQKKASEIAKAILVESKRYGFDPIFVVSVIQTESSFNPFARGTSGEIGLMQLMPDTGKWIAKSFNLPWKGTRTLADPIMNIRIGAAYLSVLREKFGSDGRLYISAYNMGPTAVKRAVSNDVIPVDYAKRVMSKYLKNYDQLQASVRLASMKPKYPSDVPHSRDDNT